ncbi:MAG TPA: hypothetical protein VF361_01130 [Candidatus Limnocylindrales bacterium]
MTSRQRTKNGLLTVPVLSMLSHLTTFAGSEETPYVSVLVPTFEAIYIM